MNNFLENITIPQLGDPNFQSDFDNFCTAIKNNFEKLISVQWTKGNDGSSIETKNITIDSGLDNTDTMSMLSYSIISAIFGDGSFSPTSGWLDGPDPIAIWRLNELLDGTYNNFGVLAGDGIAPPYNQERAIPDMQDTPTAGLNIDIIIDEHNGEAYIAAPFVFIDNRIKGLNEYVRTSGDIDAYKTFHDFSTVVYARGKYDANVLVGGQPPDPADITTWSWTAWRHDMIPKLYFDDNVHEFCWLINNQYTGVTAQGIKGNDGITASILTAHGTRNQDIIDINEIQLSLDNGQISWLNIKSVMPDISNYVEGNEQIIKQISFKDASDNEIILRDIDYILVFYDGEDPNHNPIQSSGQYRWAFFGKPHINDLSVQIYCESNASDDIFHMMVKQDFRNHLNRIWEDTTPPDMRGIFIPARKNMGDQFSWCHMIWSEDNTSQLSKLHSAPVPEQATYSNNPMPTNQTIGDWQIDYNIKVQGNADFSQDMNVQGNLSTQGNMNVQGNSYIQGNAGVQGDLTVQGNIVGKGITIQGSPFRQLDSLRPAVICRFTDTKCSVEKNIDILSTQGYPKYLDNRFGYSVVINTNLNIKVGMLSHTYNTQPVPGTIEFGTDINRQFHKMVGRYGVAGTSSLSMQGVVIDPGTPGYMWGEGTIGNKIEDDAERVFNAGDLHNGPKMYDAIEYNIPISFTKSTNYIAQINNRQLPYTGLQSPEYNNISHSVITAQGSGSNILMRYKGSDNSSGNWCIGVQGPSSMSNLNDISYRVILQGVCDSPLATQQTAADGPGRIEYRSIEGNTINMSDTDVIACSQKDPDSYVDGYLSTVTIPGALKELIRYIQVIQPVNNNKFSFTGKIDYKGETLNYYIDFFIRIQEIIGRSSGTATYPSDSDPQAMIVAPDIIYWTNKSDLQMNVIPIGYIEGFGGYKAPVFGGLPVGNYIPQS